MVIYSALTARGAIPGQHIEEGWEAAHLSSASREIVLINRMNTLVSTIDSRGQCLSAWLHLPG